MDPLNLRFCWGASGMAVVADPTEIPRAQAV